MLHQLSEDRLNQRSIDVGGITLKRCLLLVIGVFRPLHQCILTFLQTLGSYLAAGIPISEDHTVPQVNPGASSRSTS